MTPPDSRARRVVVVGAGPAGAATAWALARRGLDVLVLDRARFPRDKPCGEYLSPQASRVLEAMGALDRVESAGGAQLGGMVVRAPNGAEIHGQFAAGHGFRGFRDRGLALRRIALDPILLQCARDAGATIVEGAKVTDLARDARGRVTGVRVSESGHARTIDAALVVGADGLRSIVARRLGVARSARWPRRVALVTHYRGIAGLGEHGEMHVERGGYLGIAPVGGGEANVAVVVPVSRAHEIAGDATGFLERWIASCAQLAPRFAIATRTSPVLATGPFASHARRPWAPGAALVGDAADFFDPFTGEGIYAALRGAELLAPRAAAAVDATVRGDARAADRALAAYARDLRREFRGKRIVERMVGTTIAFPALINRAAGALSRRRDMADLLVGVTGDFVPAREVLRVGYVLRLLMG